MKTILKKLTSVSHYYKLLLQLVSFISNIKLSYLIFFLILIFSAFFEISLLGFLYVLLKAFIDPNYYQGNFLFKYFLNIFNIKSNSELILYLSIFFIITCLIAGITRIFFIFVI